MRNRALWAEISDIVDKEGRAAERRSQMASQNGDTIEKTTGKLVQGAALEARVYGNGHAAP